MTAVPYTERAGRFITFDHTEFAFDSTDPESREGAHQRMTDYGYRLRATLEKQAGRPLTMREIVQGIEHHDDRTIRERVRQESKIIEPEPSEERNPFLDRIEPKKRLTRAEFMQRNAEDWERRKQAAREEAEAEAAKSADPKRAKAIEHARTELYRLRYDQRASVADVKSAEARLSLAVAGDLDAYAAADRDYRAAKQEQLQAETAEIEAKIQELEAKKSALGEAFALPEVEATNE